MIICNTRCLSDPFSGMSRYTTELLRRLPDIRRIAPPSMLRGESAHLWEHLVIPFQIGKRDVLWSPANTGPIWGRTRQVVTVHDLATIIGPDSDALPRRAMYYRWLLPRLLSRATAVLTVSEYSRQQIISRFKYPEDRILAIPLGVDHDRFFPQSPKTVHDLCDRLAVKAGYVLSVGSGSARKNLGRLLRAWNTAQRSVPDHVELVIAGDVAAHGRAFDGSKLPPLPPRTRLVGRVSDNDLPSLLSGAGLFAFPSLFEGFGLPPLEAMACGTPCVVSDTTSLPEVVGHAALLVNPLDHECISQAIVRLLNDTTLQLSLTRNGLSRARRFTWDLTAAQTLDFLVRAD